MTNLEINFMEHFLLNNGCGAKIATDLLEDNYSYQDMPELLERFPNMNHQQIGGVLSSLIQKNLINFETRDDDTDLYFVSEKFLNHLPAEKLFTDIFKDVYKCTKQELEERYELLEETI